MSGAMSGVRSGVRSGVKLSPDLNVYLQYLMRSSEVQSAHFC